MAHSVYSVRLYIARALFFEERIKLPLDTVLFSLHSIIETENVRVRARNVFFQLVAQQ